MGGERAEGHGLFVRLKAGVVVGDALEDAASHGDFDVEGLEQGFGDGHGLLPKLTVVHPTPVVHPPSDDETV